ncbi:ATP-dependent DNA helicase RecG [Shimazuella sp. AN120528]|uniref:ATP-dependent DNA helicase RecG n=1 Tax=Shimazuella soli TaxID=1892854 RepID=UPI001F0E4D27|nr:ATP-dependent DNA helicase RecG [Shimazuella soli]MCH5584940.1 ATP-dependent DNA helicase RecG [Shimazuella soli]
MTKLTNVPVTVLPGVGPERAIQLAELGIKSMEDLLTYYPFRYDNYQLINPVDALHEERVTFRGKIVGSPSMRWFGKKQSRLTVKMEVDNIPITVMWFNQHYLKPKLSYGSTVMVTGRWDREKLLINGERTFFSQKEQEAHLGQFEPIYSVTSKIKVSWLRKLIMEAFKEYGSQIEEVLPASLRSKYRLISRAKAIYYLHFPRDIKDGHQARRSIVYEELFLYECRLIWSRLQNRHETKGISREIDERKLKEMIDNLSFPLTSAQQRVVDEICADLKSPFQMNRLLQGDVGSGKTVVAAIALYANYLSGYQGALMVPTEILADQHATSLKSILEKWGLKVVTLTGNMKAASRRETLEQIQQGSADVIVGTHALIQEAVVYQKLGLVITDEQHRFGVKQRGTLREKGEFPDVLMMTATPIPRTLAISVYGEMDVSIIDEMPAGREPIATYWVKKEAWKRIMAFVAKECKAGRQAYIICPLIEESEKLDLANAVELFEQVTLELSPIRVGLLHGRMSSVEKEEIMGLYEQNDVQVLISTTVIEVGVNVPNATVMVIYDADRFGLAQLHQLRGRVGRGGGASTCVLVANPKSETGKERMEIMTETTDGFVISERDLQMRGPGDFLGVKQSGLPEFRLADLTRDERILEVARNDAKEILQSKDGITSEEYEDLLKRVQTDESILD